MFLKSKVLWNEYEYESWTTSKFSIYKNPIVLNSFDEVNEFGQITFCYIDFLYNVCANAQIYP